MQSKNYLQSKMHLLGSLFLAVILTSCGTYQYAGYEEDAIYGDSQRGVEYVEPQEETPVAAEQNDNGYYKNYFKEKSLQYEGIDKDDAIFTDIDSYEGSYNEDQDSLRYTERYNEGYGAWGQDHNDDVVINIYGGHAFNSIWWNRPIGWGWGWNNWGWNRPWGWNAGWGWGWNNWGWGGWNHWDPFWCPPVYGIGYAGYWGPAWYGNGFYGGYYGNRVAFTNSRRSAYGNAGLAGLSRRSSVYGNNNTVRRSSANNSTVRRNTTTRSDVRNRHTSRTRPNVNTNSRTRPNTTVRNRPSNNRSDVNQKSRPRVNQRSRPTSTSRSRPTTTRRNNSSYSRPRSNMSRSGGTSRSSGYSPSRSSGSRSSGVSRSGSSRRGGRM